MIYQLCVLGNKIHTCSEYSAFAKLEQVFTVATVIFQDENFRICVYADHIIQYMIVSFEKYNCIEEFPEYIRTFILLHQIN